MEGRGIKHDLISCVGQLELANIPIEGSIIEPDEQGIHDGSCDLVCLPTHYGENVHTDVMTHDFGMVIDGGEDPQVFPKPLPKDPCRFPYVLLITI